MGRLSAYAKNRILKLRFKKNKRIIHIVDILKRDDNIKVSRQAVSTFLKKYLETNSIYDKPRTGRKRKLTQEEIQLIGQVTRLNRDITARAIKEYLNLNVSTYTILRATKLFEWNKVNPNSNDSKKAAALERQVNGDIKPVRSSSTQRTTRKYTKRKSTALTSDAGTTTVNMSTDFNEDLNMGLDDDLNNQTITDMSMNNEDDEVEKIQLKPLTNQELNKKLKAAAIQNQTNLDSIDATTLAATSLASLKLQLVNNTSIENENFNNDNNVNINLSSNLTNTPSTKHRNTANAIPDFEKVDLNLIPHRELLILKNLSCSPMSFATKILFKIFKIEELHGHNVSGKTLNKNLKSKLPLDPIRIGYIKFLVEKYYDEKECKEMLHGATSTKQDLWKSCHTAINKSILISERKAALAQAHDGADNVDSSSNRKSLNNASESCGDNSNDSKSKLNDLSTNESLVDSDTEIAKKYFTNSKIANNKANKKSKNINQKRRRRSYSLSSSSSSSQGEFDENLMSEEFDSDQDQEHNDDEVEIELNSHFMKSKSTNQRRPPKRQKKKKTFQHELDNDSDSQDDVDNEDEFANEIELIQNIENRLVNPKALTSPQKQQDPNTSSNKRTGSSNNKDDVSSEQIIEKNKLKEESSEASAAANIAAAMKKRFVVVASSTDQLNQSLSSSATSNQATSQSANNKQKNQNENASTTVTSKKTNNVLQRQSRSRQSNQQAKQPQQSIQQPEQQEKQETQQAKSVDVEITIKKEKESPVEPVLVEQSTASSSTSASTSASNPVQSSEPTSAPAETEIETPTPTTTSTQSKTATTSPSTSKTPTRTFQTRATKQQQQKQQEQQQQPVTNNQTTIYLRPRRIQITAGNKSKK